jgi:hypothetical protein
MSDPDSADVVYHLFVDLDQVPIATSALRMLIADEAHEPEIRRLARGVLDGLVISPASGDVHRVGLSAAQMKIVHTAFKLALDDTQREQVTERAVLRDLLDKLPDEHTIRAIKLD